MAKEVNIPQIDDAVGGFMCSPGGGREPIRKRYEASPGLREKRDRRERWDGTKKITRG